MTSIRLPTVLMAGLSVVAPALLGFAAAAAEARLLMFEQPGCSYCARWNAEVGPKYPLTEEGKTAPLERLQIHGVIPAGYILERPPVFTPTFVLLDDGEEVGRIEGYPGEDFFWPLLADLIGRLEAEGR